MADRTYPTIFNFKGGYATDLAPQVRELNFLARAENVIYELSGAARKVGGGARINSTQISGGPDVVGMYDFHRGGGAAAFTQQFVLVTGDSKIYKEDMDGVYDDITGAASITANTIPVFAQATDLLTIWTSNNDAPLKYNQTGNVASLGGTPPVGRGMVFHANRGWAWGANANASRLYYSASGNIEDWTGGDTGSIDIDPEDGDRIVGATSHKQNLIIFKGPNRGSIHVISGTTVSTFARTVLVSFQGEAIQTHNSIIPVADDVWFMTDIGIRSLAATQKFGNFQGAVLTRFLRGYFETSLNRSRLDRVWGVDYHHKGAACWAVTAVGASENNQIFGLSYQRNEEEGLKAFTWKPNNCISIATRDNPSSGIQEFCIGRTNGYVLRFNQPNRALETSTAYTFRITTPSILLGAVDSQGKPKGDQPVTLQRLWMRSQPLGDWNVSVSLTRDDLHTTAYNFNQGSGSIFTMNDSVLGNGVALTGDEDVLGGGNLKVTYSDPPVAGECRSLTLDITQGGLNQDANIYEIGVDWTPAGSSEAAEL